MKHIAALVGKTCFNGGIEVFLIILFAAGLVVLYMPQLQDLKKMTVYRLRLWAEGFRAEDGWIQTKQEVFQKQFPEHLRRLLQVTLSMGTRKSVRGFLILSGTLGGSILLVMACWTSAGTAVTAAAMGTCLPYLLLQCLVQEKQAAGSHEGEILVTELLNNYKIHYCNMPQAIEVTAATMDGAPYCRQLLLNLSRGLNRMSDMDDLKLLVEEFRFALGTCWAGILATNLYLACGTGLRVTESLSDLAKSMERARQIEEFSRRENNEGRLILRYLVPGGGIMMTAGGIHFFGLTARQWVQYQFQTSTGLTWFLLFILTWIGAAGMQRLFSQRKLDL